MQVTWSLLKSWAFFFSVLCSQRSQAQHSVFLLQQPLSVQLACTHWLWCWKSCGWCSIAWTSFPADHTVRRQSWRKPLQGRGQDMMLKPSLFSTLGKKNYQVVCSFLQLNSKTNSYWQILKKRVDEFLASTYIRRTLLGGLSYSITYHEHQKQTHLQVNPCGPTYPENTAVTKHIFTQVWLSMSGCT